MQCSNISLCAEGRNLVVCLHSRTKTFRVVLGMDDEDRDIDDVVEEIMVLINNVSSVKNDIVKKAVAQEDESEGAAEEDVVTVEHQPITIQDVMPVAPPEVPESVVPPVMDGPGILEIRE